MLGVGEYRDGGERSEDCLVGWFAHLLKTGSLLNPDWPGMNYIDQTGLESVAIPLPLLPKCWYYRCTSILS